MEDKTAGEHLDPTSEISLASIKQKAVKGVAVLTGRTLILNFISLVSQGFLWLFITPTEFGVFILVSATINFLSYFADIGLGAALIQKKEKPKEADFATVFFVQEVLVVAIVLIVFLVAPILVKTHSLSDEGRNLLYALNISFFLASLKNIPSIILERRLDFGKFVIPQVLENLVYSLSVVYFAYLGLGITSFTYSVLLRGIVGVIAIYLISPWRPVFKFSQSSLTDLLKFGLPYQVNSFLATIKDDGITIVIGSILGPYNLGILGTAQKLAQYPLRFFMDNVNKVTFPAFSRMQENKEDLAKAVTRSIFFICALVFPSLVGLIILFPTIIEVIPKYQKWEPAYLPLIFLSVGSMWAAVTTQLTNVLASIGKIKIDLKLMVMWTVLTWLLVPFFSRQWGLVGVSMAYAIIASSSIVAFVISKKYINWLVKDSILMPLVSSAIMGMVLFWVENVFETHSIYTLFLLVVVGSIIYAGLLYLILGKVLASDVKKIFAGLSRQ